VSGIGPKLALAMLSGLPARALAQAVVNSDLPRLISIPGVGRKTAERVLVDLREPLAKLLALAPEPIGEGGGLAAGDELLSALVNLGYKERIVRRVIEKLAKRFPPETPLEELIRAALHEMQK
ncbi:MAG: Holliday junction branch migration protein RuvA, partial [Myxococcales bacterium]